MSMSRARLSAAGRPGAWRATANRCVLWRTLGSAGASLQAACLYRAVIDAHRMVPGRVLGWLVLPRRDEIGDFFACSGDLDAEEFK